ncbi:MAG TPA: hypothetical protein RMH99_30095 [Sandaracinaceae bacterium LLY-WYZ-13_1]|nr:hypothetical protein [Sandaracinaceae bacterium LLY-WYZ-13_1]
MKRTTWLAVGWTLGVLGLVGATASGPARAQTRDEQSVLGPGMYVFQTRTRSASCGDDERTGYVSSFVAPIHGIPGARTMRMQLVNSPYWSAWSVTVHADGRVVAESTLDGAEGPNAPTNRFEVRRDGDRFTGRGTRSYTATIDGRRRRCEVRYDALLRRIDR